jgi:hypothetical protein
LAARHAARAAAFERRVPLRALRTPAASPLTRLQAPFGNQLLVLLLVHDVEHGLLLLHLKSGRALDAPLASGLELLQHARQL